MWNNPIHDVAPSSIRGNIGACNAETELEDDLAEITAETGLVGAIDGDDAGVAGVLPLLDHNDVVPRYPHDWEVVSSGDDGHREEHCRS